MLELYQFELSHYCEKVRLILDYKGLSYRKIEITPGIGQLDIFRMSGQRQVPVLKDGNEVIADSTEIALYLDRKYPDRPLIPTDTKERAQCFILEQWADESVGINARKLLINAVGQDSTFLTSALPSGTPGFLRSLVQSVPREAIEVVGFGAGASPDAVKTARKEMHRSLESLSNILRDQPYLVGDQLTLADLAVAAMTMYVKFPVGTYLELPAAIKGKGSAELINDPMLQPFWDWRDRIYADFRKAPLTAASSAASSSSGGPTSINID
ncbi:glutathione S-transferase family protein [Leptolyngbya ohadii]|uniref:glutathione S-transferase family protein n=1 Tax=Leptolyngbya ohadii TaxID=1962290 RepID=UPI000B59DD74|nr:glutathione S-transferase family protein [Leptolyngbya ohadii]